MNFYKTLLSTVELKFLEDYRIKRGIEAETLNPSQVSDFWAYRNSEEGVAAFQELYDSAPETP